MEFFGRFFLDKEKDIIVSLYREGETLRYELTTPNHHSGNLIRNLAACCSLPLSYDEKGLLVVRGEVPCYRNGRNETVYFLRLGDAKVANIYPDGTVARKATIPAIVKTLMSQTKDYRLDPKKTLVKTYILSDVKFRTDLHTHMNANLDPDVLIALGIRHQIRYPLYYIKKLGLRVTDEQQRLLDKRRAAAAERFSASELKGKYLERRIDDNTFLNFADLMLASPENAAVNLPRIRASLAVLKDGQAVFTNLEKVYLYRYVFTKGVPSEDTRELSGLEALPDEDLVRTLRQMEKDRAHPVYKMNTLFQNKLLWIARGYQSRGIEYAEISDTSLVKKEQAAETLRQIHAVLPAIREETGVLLRFLAAIRRIPLTIVKDRVGPADYLQENLRVLRAVALDPYVAGGDIVGEEMNDIRVLKPVLAELVRLSAEKPGFVVRVHAGENDALRDNVANAIACVEAALAPGQPMPAMRIGHGLYTADLHSPKGRQLLRTLREREVVLEFQITSNVRLNNLSSLERHPLKAYLSEGVACVQGTDGAALYGTDPIDEQLALERLLQLSHAELAQMRQAEEKVLRRSLRDFDAQSLAFQSALGSETLTDYFARRLREEELRTLPELMTEKRFESQSLLPELVAPLPEEGVPVVVCGGSFHNESHHCPLRPDILALLDTLLEKGDPEKLFFVVGHRLSGYERYLLEQNRGRFAVYAFVPSLLGEREAARLGKSGVRLRISIEPMGSGLYKSLSYEIFKRRKSVVLALDGNSAGANLIQEAKNSRIKHAIFVSERCRVLKAKAQSLQGYARLFTDGQEIADELLALLQ